MALPTDPEELKQVFARAAEIATAVPPNLQEAAFQRALDALLGPAEPGAPPPGHPSPSAPSIPRVGPEPKGGGDNDSEPDPAAILIERIDRTEFAEVMAGRRVLDKALLVLRAAHHHGITSLTPGEIARVLTEKFRESTSDAAVRMALGNDDSYTDRVRKASGFAYRLMAPGERHLAAL